MSLNQPRFMHGVPLLAGLLLLSVAAVVSAQDMKPEDVYHRAVQSVATLTVEEADGSHAEGNAFMALKDGLAVTAWHVVKGAVRVMAKFSDGQEFEVSGLVDKDEKRDVAVVKIKVFGRPGLATSAVDPAVGSKAYVIGAPRGMEFSITEGLVSQIQILDGVRYYQFSCAASPGNSGGPLLNAKGKAIGVVDWQIRNGQNLNFAVPISYVLGLDTTLPTQPWADVKADSSSAGSPSADAAGIDAILADSVVSCEDATTAIQGTLDIIKKTPCFTQRTNHWTGRVDRTWMLFTPTYLYRCQEDLKSRMQDLTGLVADGARAKLRDSLLPALTAQSEAAQGLVDAIKTAQQDWGWAPAAQEKLRKAVASGPRDPLDKAALLEVGKSDDFRSRIPKDWLVRMGLAEDPDWFPLGVASFTYAPLNFILVADGSLAYRMGFRSGDALATFAGEKPKGITELKAAIRANRGKDVALVVLRGGKEVTLKTTVPKELPVK